MNTVNVEPIENRKIRFGLVGAGRIADRHFDALRLHEKSAELVAVCDNDADRLKMAMSTHGVAGFNSLAEMLSQSHLDVVIITTPSGLHTAQTIQVAEAGLHVVTEKPMATRWNDGLRMVQACDQANVRLFVVKQNRSNATLQLLKQAIDSKRFGKINMVNINVFWTRPQSYYDQDDWRGTWEFDGGALMNQASHYIDLLDWLIGPVETLHAFASTLSREIFTEDTAALNIKWRSGALGSMNVTMLTYPKNYEGSITILGEKGTVRIGGVAVNEIQHWEFEDEQPEDSQLANVSYETTSVYGFGHPLYYKNVIECLQGRATPDVDGREGLKSLELLTAAYRSARDNVAISLPLEC